MTLAQDFATLFEEAAAREKLADLSEAQRTDLPTFNLTTTSLRHLNKWFDRLEEIQTGQVPADPHGNYFSDPATIGLVDAVSQQLTPAGAHYLSLKPLLYSDPARAEYELLKILYFSDFDFSHSVTNFLHAKREALNGLLVQFPAAPSRSLFLSDPVLLTIAELLSSFPGAVPRLINLPTNILVDLSELGEDGFKELYSARDLLPGLERLCKRIGNDYTRSRERRLNYLVSMALLSINGTLQPNVAIALQIPMPFSNILTEVDIYNLHVQYTDDMNVWFDGSVFEVSNSLQAIRLPAAPITRRANILPLDRVPSGRGQAAPNDQRRSRRRAFHRTRIEILVDQAVSERAEDFVEAGILATRQNLVRSGHRDGESIALPDGMVPGADFYSLDANQNPIEFIEVKALSGDPPATVAVTRAEFLRARLCVDNNIPYRLVLVNMVSSNCWEIPDFGKQIASILVENLVQFSVRVG